MEGPCGVASLSGFDLLANPFALIGVSLRATRAQINDALEDALFADDSPIHQRELDNARQALFSPRTRLEAEFAFLCDCDEEALTEILASLRGGEAAQGADSLAGLDRANYLAHRCVAGNGEARARTAKSLAFAYDGVSFDLVVAHIKLARKASEFGAVDLENARQAFNSIRARHAEAALDGLLSVPTGPEVVASLACELAEPQSGRHEFLQHLINQYEARMGPEIERAADEVRRELGKLDYLSDASAIRRFEVALLGWARLARPLQVADAACGIDEPHSRELFGSIRERSLDLCNRKAQYASAVIISNIAKRVFAELPDVASVIDEDLTALEALVAHAQLQSALTPLTTLLEAAGGDLAKFSREAGNLRNSQQLNAILAELDSALASGDPALAGLAVDLVRSLAINLANDTDDNRGALAITNALLLRKIKLADDTVLRLQSDRDILMGNVEAASAKPMTSAPSLRTTNGTGFKLYGHTDEKADGSYLATYYWVLFHFPIFPLARYRVIGEGNRYLFLAKVPLRTYDLSYLVISIFIIIASASTIFQSSEGTVPNQSYAMKQPDANVGIDNSNVSDDGQETIPPLSSYENKFDRSQVRYCMMQKQRLQSAKKVAINPTESQAERFNSAVKDFNSRCSNFRYRDYDMTAVEQEMSGMSARLRTEGAAIVNGDN